MCSRYRIIFKFAYYRRGDAVIGEEMNGVAKAFRDGGEQVVCVIFIRNRAGDEGNKVDNKEVVSHCDGC